MTSQTRMRRQSPHHETKNENDEHEEGSRRSDDLIAPLSVGEYMRRHIPSSTLKVIENVGHCPHLSAPSASVDAIEEFLARL